MSLKGLFMGMTSGVMVWYKHRPLTHFYVVGRKEAGTQLFAFGSVTWASPPHSVLLKDTSCAFHFSLLSLPGPGLSNYLLQNPKLRIPKEHTLPLPPPLTPHCGALKASEDLLDARTVQALEKTERLLSYPCFHDLVIFSHELVLWGVILHKLFST